MKISELYEAITKTMRYLNTAHGKNYILWWYDKTDGLHTREARMVYDKVEDRERMARHPDFWPPNYEPDFRGRYDTKTKELTAFTRQNLKSVPKHLKRTLQRQFPDGYFV